MAAKGYSDAKIKIKLLNYLDIKLLDIKLLM